MANDLPRGPSTPLRFAQDDMLFAPFHSGRPKFLRALQLERSAKMGDEALAEFDGIAGGQVRPLGTGEAA
jgi:hypothetical protein